MDSMNLMPVGCESGWGNGGAAALGAFVGSWFGNGTGGFGNRGNIGDVATVAAVETGIVLDSLSAIQNSINSGTLAFVNGQNTTNMALANGFANTAAATYQSGVDTRFAINSLGQQMADCCCELKGAVMGEGAATRQLIQQNMITELQTQLCDAKSKIGSLESNAYLCASQQAQTQQIVQTVLAHLNPKG